MYKSKSLLVFFAVLFSICINAQSANLVNAFPNISFNQPVFLTNCNDGTDRIFVVQQDGIIKVFPNETKATSVSTFLDISSKTHSSGGEQGLLGLAFHPEFSSNGFFYVNFTAPGPRRTVVARYSVSSSDPNISDPESEMVILEINQPYGNHNGGMLLFGLDGYLYIGTGDGGSGGDPENRAQNLGSLLGKMLRINVDETIGNTNYSIPTDNPFITNSEGYRKEIYTWGLRNPWRYSQDPITGLIYIADVGQNTREEINILKNGDNYGWRCYEGNIPYNTEYCGEASNYTFPIKEYANAGSDCSITGGYVYRGQIRPELTGAYIYGDFCSGKIWLLRYENEQILNDSLLIDSPFLISSFGTDEAGELYICSYQDGNIYRFDESPNTDIRYQGNVIPNSIILEQNYPNPFNISTKLRFYLTNNALVQNKSLQIFNTIGEAITEFDLGNINSGWNSIIFNGQDRFGSSLPSGIYFVQFLVGSEYQQTIKMNLLK